MLVPENCVQLPSRDGTDERIATPGALTSGFSRSASVVGPLEEKDATTSDLETAATEIASAAVPGEETEPRPNSSKSFPAATTGTTPAAAAPFTARSTMLRAEPDSISP